LRPHCWCMCTGVMALSTASVLQGVVPEYLMGFHDYITSLSPKQIPDYEWLMMQLDSGVTGQSPGRQPLRCQLADWPSPGDLYSRQDYALVSQTSSTCCRLTRTHAPLHRSSSLAGCVSLRARYFECCQGVTARQAMLSCSQIGSHTHTCTTVNNKA
jgi:hypothetical protein